MNWSNHGRISWLAWMDLSMKHGIHAEAVSTFATFTRLCTLVYGIGIAGCWSQVNIQHGTVRFSEIRKRHLELGSLPDSFCFSAHGEMGFRRVYLPWTDWLNICTHKNTKEIHRNPTITNTWVLRVDLRPVLVPPWHFRFPQEFAEVPTWCSHVKQWNDTMKWQPENAAPLVTGYISNHQFFRWHSKWSNELNFRKLHKHMLNLWKPLASCHVYRQATK